MPFKQNLAYELLKEHFLNMWDFTHGQIIWAFVISYGYAFYLFRSNSFKNLEKVTQELLEKHSLKGLILAVIFVIFTEATCIIVSFIISVIFFIFVLPIINIIGNMVG